jgi:hypothetical protein
MLASSLSVVLHDRDYAQDLVSGVGHIVNNTMDLLVGGGIDIRQKPVVEDISLDTPGQDDAIILLDKVDKASLGIRDSTRRTSQLVRLNAAGGLSSSLTLDRELKDAASSAESHSRLRESPLLQWVLGWESTSEEVVAVREDLAIGSDLFRYISIEQHSN